MWSSSDTRQKHLKVKFKLTLLYVTAGYPTFVSAHCQTYRIVNKCFRYFLLMVRFSRSALKVLGQQSCCAAAMAGRRCLCVSSRDPLLATTIRSLLPICLLPLPLLPNNRLSLLPHFLFHTSHCQNHLCFSFFHFYFDIHSSNPSASTPCFRSSY